jgi:hypothetical protein
MTSVLEKLRAIARSGPACQRGYETNEKYEETPAGRPAGQVNSLNSFLSVGGGAGVGTVPALRPENLPAEPPAAAPDGDQVIDDLEERAAIVEYTGNIPRQWAEGFARLDPDRPPADVPPRRWRRFVDDVGLFLDSPFCAVAAALGWGPFDLFGCDRNRPFARLDQSGMLWLVNGDRLIMLAEDTAMIETKTGARQTWHRKPAAPGRVLAWELQ